MPTKVEKKILLTEMAAEIAAIAHDYIDSLDDSDPMPANLDLIKLATEVYEDYQKNGEG